MPGMFCIAGAAAGIAIEQEQLHPPPQASASLAQQARPQQLRTVVATNFNMVKTPRCKNVNVPACLPIAQGKVARNTD